MATANFESFFSISGDVGLYPTLSPKTDIPDFQGYHRLNYIEGFAGGDTKIDVGFSSTGSIDYLDSSNSSFPGWPILPTAILASGEWAGIRMDATGTNLEVIVVDTATTTNTFLFASITADGTITAGSAGAQQPATDFSSATPIFHAVLTTQNIGLYRPGDTGNYILRYGDSADNTVEELIFNSTTGAIVGDTTLVLSNALSGGGTTVMAYKTANGTLCGNFDVLTTESLCNVDLAKVGTPSYRAVSADIPIQTGMPRGVFGLQVLEWKGYIVYNGGSASADALLARGFETLTFDTFIDSVAAAVGIV